MVILSHGSFSFEDLNEDTGLVISIGSENLGFLSGDGGVSGDQSGHDSSSGFDTHGKRGDIQ